VKLEDVALSIGVFMCGASHKGEAKGKLLEVPSTKAAYKKNAGVFLPPLPSKSLTWSGKINPEKLNCFATIKGLTLCSKLHCMDREIHGVLNYTGIICPGSSILFPSHPRITENTKISVLRN
jgi:hypothetical protein